MQPLRSVLYVPANKEKALNKIATLHADHFIIDLEDAVSKLFKIEAREELKAFLEKSDCPKEKITIRINGLTTEWFEDDLMAFANSGVHSILLPKVEKTEDIKLIEDRMRHENYPADTKIWAMIETPLGVLNAQEIAHCSQHLDCLVMGTSDLAKDLKAAHRADRLPFLYSFSQVIHAARAYGLHVLDGVHLAIDNENGFHAACVQGKDLGFDGKTLIHPDTITICNDVYAPGESDISWAKLVIEAYEEAQEKGDAVIKLYGQLIEELHYQEARELLDYAKACERA